jgi:phage baseplate assembly protein W
MKATFLGFSTVGRRKPPFKLTDNELIKQDLLNNFNTTRGEMVMNCEYGTIIHQLIMDPLDERTKGLILDDVLKVILADPRVRMTSSIRLSEMENGVRVEVELLYNTSTTPEKLIVDFNKNLETQ